MNKDPKLLVQAPPLLRQQLTTPSAMRDVIYALCPIIFASCLLFGSSALLILLVTVAGAVITEYLFPLNGKRGESLHDGSAVLTGLILALTLPPSLPLWIAFLGGVASIALGKLVWGGLGQNLFNPALVGRAFLMASFPTAMTTWSTEDLKQGFFDIQSSNFALPLMQGQIDGITAATPLGQMKFEQQATAFDQLFWGNTTGSLGETSAALIILAAVFLLWRRIFDWRIPASILLTVAAFSSLFYFYDPVRFPDPLFTLLSGGLLFGVIFMASDPVSSPLTTKGTWLFGIGIGVLVVLIRLFGGFPEGVMYAILLMNAATPLIDRISQPTVFGHGRSATHSRHTP